MKRSNLSRLVPKAIFNVCSPQGTLLVGGACRGSSENRVFPKCCVGSQQQKKAHTYVEPPVKNLLHLDYVLGLGAGGGIIDRT